MALGRKLHRAALLSTTHMSAGGAHADLPNRGLRGAWVAGHIAEGSNDERATAAAAPVAGETLRLRLVFRRRDPAHGHSDRGQPQGAGPARLHIVGRLESCASTRDDLTIALSGPKTREAGLAGLAKLIDGPGGGDPLTWQWGAELFRRICAIEDRFGDQAHGARFPLRTGAAEGRRSGNRTRWRVRGGNVTALDCERGRVAFSGGPSPRATAANADPHKSRVEAAKAGSP